MSIISLSESEKGYLAGIIDAVGSMGIYCSKCKQSKPPYNMHNQVAVRLVVGSTSPEIIEWLDKKIPDTYIHSAPAKDKGGRIMHTWVTSSRERVRSILDVVLPYLIIKKKQAEWILKWINDEVSTDDAIQIVKKLKRPEQKFLR